MGLYSKQGLYAGYKKNNKEREALDYYATPPQEVKNILEILGLDFYGRTTVLEPCAGGGHMVQGIKDFFKEKNMHSCSIIATDIKERNLMGGIKREEILTGEEYDFLSDDYPYNKADYVIMNPPFATIEPFVIRGLEIAQRGLLVFGRLQFLEGQSRYENIIKNNPPSDVYIYVDRIKCGKNGDFANTEAIQAYAWFYWDKFDKRASMVRPTQLHWIRRK